MQASGLLYPSIATAANDDNLVFKPEAADQRLKLVSVQYVEVATKNGNSFTYEFKGLDFADSILEGGTIEWHGSFPNTLCPGTDLRLDFDGDLVLKNGRGIVAGKFTLPGE